MPKTKAGKGWEQGFRATVRSNTTGWTVSPVKGRIQLRWRPTDGRKHQSVVLPLEWSSDNQARAVLLVNQVAKLMLSNEHDSLKGALEAAQAMSTTMRKATDWPVVAESLRITLMQGRNEILPNTWKSNYQPYINEALHLLESNQAINDGHSLLQVSLQKWTGKAASRAACCIALRNLTEHAIARHRAANCWQIDTASIKELKGKTPKKRTKATLDDSEILYLVNGIEERNPGWANVIRLLTLYGLRPVELQYLKPKKRDDGNIGMWCSYSKNCGGALTDPRWLEPCPLTNEAQEIQHWNLAGELKTGLLELPLGKNGEPRLLDGHYCEQFLKHQPEWLELKERYLALGEWLRGYTFRDSYSLRCHRNGIEIGAIAQAMGHSVAVHSSSYRWSSTETTTAAFASAFDKELIS
jgi:integrase